MDSGKSRLEQTQDEVEEVRVIMLDNMQKVDERSEKLNELEDRAVDLHAMTKTFEKNTDKVKNQKRWENKKMKVIFIAVGVGAALIIIGLIIFAILQGQ